MLYLLVHPSADGYLPEPREIPDPGDAASPLVVRARNPAGSGGDPGSDLTAAAAAAIQNITPGHTVAVVAAGQGVRDLPRLSLALRAGRRATSGYVLINPELVGGRVEDPLIPPGADWPDAPVLVLDVTSTAQAQRQAQLRGWSYRATSAADVRESMLGWLAEI